MILVMANPSAGRGRRKQIEAEVSKACGHFAASGKVELVWTQSGSEAVRLLRKAPQAGVDLVVAAGGDGTIRLAAEALAGTRTALSFLPLGTENVLAKFLRLPRNLETCAREILRRPVREVDLGQVNGKKFLLFLGIGFDASVVRQTSKAFKQSLGGLALAFTAVSKGFGLRDGVSRFRIKGEDLDLEAASWQALIGNISIYGWRLPIFPSARMNDGILEGRLFPPAGAFGKLGQVARMAGKFSIKNETLFRFKKITIDTERPVDLQADGDWIGTTPCEVSVAASALRVRF